jgi:hypothetical protein
MKISAVLTLVIVGGIVWGGMIYFLSSAIRHERAKKNGKNS